MSEKWDGKVYQEYRRFIKRVPLFVKYGDIFKNKNVLDVGCNAGIYGWHIIQVANSYVGLEQNPVYAAQAQETLSGKCAIVNSTFKDFPKDTENINALFLGLVLYHLCDEEVEMMREYIKKMDVVVVLNRAKKRSTIKNKYKLNKLKSVLKLLGGYKCKIDWTADKHAYIVVAIREN